MIINSDDIAVLQKEVTLPIIQSTYEDGLSILCDLAADDMSKILHSDYLFGEEFPEMLIDESKTTYHLNCYNYGTQPEWSLRVLLYPIEMTNKKKMELLDEAYVSNSMDIVYSMIMITEDAAGCGDSAYFNLTLTPEEQKIIFDLAGLDQYEQDLCLRLQNL